MPSKPKTRTSEPALTATNGIEQIRDIILGEQIAAWNKRFDKLESELKHFVKATRQELDGLNTKIEQSGRDTAHSNQELTAQISQSTSNLQELIEALKTDLLNKIDDLTNSKVDKDSIGEVFIQWGQQVKSRSQ